MRNVNRLPGLPRVLEFEILDFCQGYPAFADQFSLVSTHTELFLKFDGIRFHISNTDAPEKSPDLLDKPPEKFAVRSVSPSRGSLRSDTFAIVGCDPESLLEQERY